MKDTVITSMRLQQQQISHHLFKTPAELVQYMMAMQSQEYAMAKWAIGLRLPSCTDPIVEKAFNDGAILRTHLLRPTWHFVSPADIRWLLMLTAPRVKIINGFTYRQQELTPAIFRRSHAIIEKALEGGNYLTRKALQDLLEKKKIIAEGVRLSALMMEAELDGIICSGPRKGKQFTYALLEERAPATKKLTCAEALVQFGLRYFESRGPATIQDFACWSGLTLKDARMAAEELPPRFIREKIGDAEYIIDSKLPAKTSSTGLSFLMPVYDEYGMSYKDRSAILHNTVDQQQYLTFDNLFIVDGKVAGGWRREVKGKQLMVETSPFVKLNSRQTKELSKGIKAFTRFSIAADNT